MKIRIRGTMGVHFDRVQVAGPFEDSPWHDLSPRASQRLHNHSPDGFAWGYGGSGPAQLALAVLLWASGDKNYALRNYQQFKRQFIEPLGFGKDFEVTVDLDDLGQARQVDSNASAAPS